MGTAVSVRQTVGLSTGRRCPARWQSAHHDEHIQCERERHRADAPAWATTSPLSPSPLSPHRTRATSSAQSEPARNSRARRLLRRRASRLAALRTHMRRARRRPAACRLREPGEPGCGRQRREVGQLADVDERRDQRGAWATLPPGAGAGGGKQIKAWGPWQATIS